MRGGAEDEAILRKSATIIVKVSLASVSFEKIKQKIVFDLFGIEELQSSHSANLWSIFTVFMVLEVKF